ncbi:MAG: beta strand repeat-containing protein, partial [Lacibacter sp.]
MASSSSMGGSGSLTVSGVVSGSTFNLTKVGAGTLILSGTNTYTGSTTVSAGILRASATVAASTNGAFGNNASNLNLGGGTIQSNTTTFSRPLTVTATNSGLDAFGSARTISSTITLATAGTFNLNVGGTTAASAEGQDLTLSGVISNSSGTLNVTKIGTSTVILSAANTYTGTTTINGGTLTLGIANALPITASAGVIQFAAGTPTINLGLFNLGSSTAAANSAGALDFDVNTTINLGASGTNSYYFKASNGQTWSATTITINNWTGNPGVAGTGRRLYIGSDATGLSATQLAAIQFTGYEKGAMVLSTGEIVPALPRYRSRNTSGTWGTASDWEISIDGGTSWTTATLSPTDINSSLITIRANHTMTISSAVAIDETVVEASGTVVHNSSGTVTLSNGTGTDLQINGTWRRQGSGAISTTGTIDVGSGGVYEHNLGASGGSIPTASWNANSTLLINYTANTISSPTNLTQTFGKLEINCPSQTSTNLVFTPTNVVTEFRVTSTGSGSFQLQSLVIDGNYIQTNGTMKILQSTGTATANIKGAFTLNGGTFMITDANGSGNPVSLTIDGSCDLSGGTFIFANTSGTSGVASFILKGTTTIGSGVSFGGFIPTTTGFYFNRATAGTINVNIAHPFSSGTIRNCFYYNTTNVTGINETYNGTAAQSSVNGTNTTPASGYAAWPTTGTVIKDFTV